ncbi:MAG: succinyldiaminopimelate transaminase [Campylobacterales bacterium]|nr:succinyldiaminopimelate transaminase [Campylobacterales bacterium]
MHFEPYPFEKLDHLLSTSTHQCDLSPIALTVGEPQFPTPDFIQEALAKNASLLNKYPKTAGEDALREAQRGFMQRRFGVPLEKEMLLPTFGTREVLFNFPQYALFDVPNPVMGFVNPFYQIYEGAAIASRARVVHLELHEENDFLPVCDPGALKACDLIILNSPSNPTARVMDLEALKPWARLASEQNVIVLNDECYSEIYTTTPPPSLLEAARAVGNTTYRNTLVVNSISKRSCAPGLRSGFIAGDEAILSGYAKYRTYVGCASPLPLQMAAIKAWEDEAHVEHARGLYAQNMALAQEILGVAPSEATFYLWLHVRDGEAFAKGLYEAKGVKVLPGGYLGRGGMGHAYVRIALVETPARVEEALLRLRDFLKGWA